MSSIVEATTRAQVHAAITGTKSVIVEVHARARCAPCRAIAPHFDAASVRLAHLHAFVSVDLDAADDDAVDELRIAAVPTFVLFVDGKEIDRFSGGSADKLDRLLQRADPQWDTAFAVEAFDGF